MCVDISDRRSSSRVGMHIGVPQVVAYIIVVGCSIINKMYYCLLQYGNIYCLFGSVGSGIIINNNLLEFQYYSEPTLTLLLRCVYSVFYTHNYLKNRSRQLFKCFMFNLFF